MGGCSVLIVPGLGKSGPEHWQSLWETSHPAFTRVAQRDWDHPTRDDWVETLERHVAQAEGPTILVAHSAACSLVAHWAGTHRAGKVVGALLVAPADVDSEQHTPPGVHCFALMPLLTLPFPTTVIASTNDPYPEITRARFFAKCGGSHFVNIGAKGHINSASNMGQWEEGLVHFDEMLSRISM